MKTLGQTAYEADVSVYPFYYDGSPRKSWEHLSPICKSSWEKMPKSMTGDQIRRVINALGETQKLLEKEQSKKTFDADQEKERQIMVEFYKELICKLNNSLRD